MEPQNILVLDDNTTLLDILAHHFAKTGAKVQTATSCNEAIEKVKATHFDIALVDLLLPDHPGFDFVKAVKAMPEPHPFFAILTDSINASQVADAIEIGVTTYIQKAEHDPGEIVGMVMDRYRNQKKA
ncbi:DNA-binding response regulator [bacterium]|nr:DNA-binding response regulator [bacterium]